MRPGDLLGFAFTAVIRHRRRSALSLLGVTIGVAAVVVLTALGEGARRYVIGQFRALGTNLLVVLPGKTETVGAFPGVSGVPNDLTLEDATALSREVREARLVVPISLGNETVSHRERRRQVMVVGATHEYREVRELRMSAGRFLPRGEFERGAPVAVLGAKVARELFPGQRPVGGVVRIGDARMRVIGILEDQGTQMALNLDEVVLVPVASGMRIFNRSSLFRILIKVNAYADLDAARRRVVQVLTERHQEEDFTCITEESVIQSFSNILTALTAALGGIAAISLCVAGVGVMNLMLVSVSERTSEVGLLKAVGATRRQILWLFLAEAVLLVTAGALLGLVVGGMLVELLGLLYPGFPAAPPLWAVLAVLATAVASGVLFGALPARRATQLNPVTALAGR